MKFVPNAVSSKIARLALQTQKTSPQTLFALGIVGFSGTVVLACRATLKVEEILDRTENDLNKVESTRNSIELGRAYTDKDAKRDKTVIYVRAAADLTKLYAPAIVCGAISIGALVGSHNILSRRNAALTAAYGTLMKSFDGYRDRVRAEIGTSREQELYHDVKQCEIEDEQTGKKSVRKIANGGSPYARLFEPTNRNWEPTAEYNFMFLKAQQKFANDMLQARGHVFLNEIYDSLGLERSKEGAVVGWIKGAKDDFIDFGIFQNSDDKVVDFMIGREDSIWLDFNVDGVIYDKI